MPDFTVECRDILEIKTLWRKDFSEGTFFLASEKPFPVATEFKVFLRTKDRGIEVLFHSRVVQILERGVMGKKGMVVEWLDFRAMHAIMDDAISNLERQTPPVVIDLAQHRKKTEEAGKTLPSVTAPAAKNPKPLSKAMQELVSISKENHAKAQRLFTAAADSEKQGEFHAAFASVKIAATLDPQNPKYQAKLKELEPKAPQVKSNISATQEKMEHLLRNEARALKRGKKSDGWLG